MIGLTLTLTDRRLGIATKRKTPNEQVTDMIMNMLDQIWYTN